MMGFTNRLAAGVALAVLALTGTAAADQLQDIKQRGKLICGTLGTAAPFSFQDAGSREVVGYDVDFCKAVAKSLGVEMELKLLAVDARIPELNQGRVDILAANLGYTPARGEQIAYSLSYFVSQQKVAARKSDNFKATQDLAGKRISAIKGSTSEQFVRQVLPTASTVTFQDAPSSFLALQQGKVNGFAASELMLVKLEEDSRATVPIQILNPALKSEPWGLGVRKGEPTFLEHVNAELTKMEQSGEAKAIFDKWLGAGTPYRLTREFRIEPIKE